MTKTASQIADEVLMKLSMKMPYSGLLATVGKANANPANLAARAEKVTALRNAPDAARNVERDFRPGRHKRKALSAFERPQGELWAQGTHAREAPHKPTRSLGMFG